MLFEKVKFTVQSQFSTMIIRKAVIEDSERISTLLMLASGEVMYKFIGEEDYHKGLAFLHRFVRSTDNQYSYQNCYVVEEENQVVAALLIYDGAKLYELRKPVLDYVHEHYDATLEVEDETQAGEFYIDSLGVAANQQGKGLGSKLIHYVIQDKSKAENAIIGLLVDKKNPNAKKLYLKLGFKVVGEKQLVGLSLEHLQFEALSHLK